MDRNEIQLESSSVSLEQVLAISQRALGPDGEITSIHQIPGGTVNTIFRLTYADERQVILRLAPPARNGPWNWNETYLMRREHAIQPFFAPVAHLMPACLLIDFTHQLIDRDYMVQQYLPGERWDTIIDNLSSAQNDLLWEEFGRLLNQIHNVEGSTFGLPYPGFQFPSWSQTVLKRFEYTRQLAAHAQVNIPHLEEILNIVRLHTDVLDEIRIPKLLHGDLWLFNLLVVHDTAGPRITGLLDAELAWWGDPVADWTMFLLLHVKPPESIGHETSFWQAYGGEPDLNVGGQFRLNTYMAMHASSAVLWANRHADEHTLKHASQTLAEAASHLAAY